MTTNHRSSRTRDYTTDRLALSRAQHFQSRENRAKSVSDEEIDAISEWSDSDRECCPLSDFESTSNADNYGDYYKMSFDDDNKFFEENTLSNILQINETPLPPIINDSTTSTRISFTNENEKPKQRYAKKPSTNATTATITTTIIPARQPPLLPARRIQNKEIPPVRLRKNSQTSYNSRYRKTIIPPSPQRYQFRRETTSTSTSSTKESISPPNNLFQIMNDNQNQREIVSPSFSQTSVPRVYEVKKIFVDDYDYGRLTETSPARLPRTANRQKWGTIVHPPFPLGYQHIAPEQVTQVVERLSSPARCRDRHTPIQTPSKRYLSVEETDALINRLTKVKTIRAPEQYWPLQKQSRSVKTLNNNNNINWKTVGISA